jgi:hypothetical protein
VYTVQLLEGLTKCSVTVFRQTFNHLLVGSAKRLRQLCTLSSLHDSFPLGGIKKLCKETNDMFNALNISKEWNIPQQHCIDACFNYSDPDHGVPKCPNSSINLGLTEPSPSLPGLEADVVVVVVVVAVTDGMAMETVVVQDVGVVMVIKPTHAGSGKAMLRLSMQSPLPVGLENIRASGA